MTDNKDIKLKINIKNFTGISKCPICGCRPEEIEWGKEGLRIWCGEHATVSNHKKSYPVVIFEPIYPEDKDLVPITEKLIETWNAYCKITKERMKANG